MHDAAPEDELPRRRLPWAERRDQMLDHAERLFVEQGYAAVSMEDIARAAGVSRPIVYKHFTSKEGAYLACVRRAHADYLGALFAGTDLSAPPAAQLRYGIESYLALLEEQPGRWHLIFRNAAVLPAAYEDELTEIRELAVAMLYEQVKLTAPAAPEPDREAFANAIGGMAEGLALWWRTRPDIPRPQVVDLFVQFLADGMRPYLDPGA